MPPRLWTIKIVGALIAIKGKDNGGLYEWKLTSLLKPKWPYVFLTYTFERRIQPHTLFFPRCITPRTTHLSQRAREVVVRTTRTRNGLSHGMLRQDSAHWTTTW